MNNKAFSMKSVFSYAYAPFSKGFSKAMLLLAGLFIMVGLVQETVGNLVTIAPQVLSEFPLFVQLAGIGLLVAGFILFSFIVSAIQLNLALMVYDNKLVDSATAIPSFSSMGRYFRALSLFLLALLGYVLVVMALPVVLLYKVVNSFVLGALIILTALPLIYLVTRLSMAPYSALEGASAIQSLKKSWSITQNRFWTMITSYCVVFASIVPMALIAVLGYLLFGPVISKFVNMISTVFLISLPQMLVYVCLYRNLSAEKAAQ